MEVLHRRTTVGRLLKPLGDSRVLHRGTALGRVAKRFRRSEIPSTVRSTLAPVHPPAKAVKSALAAVGGLIGVTAGSAAVSARRKRSEGSN